MKHIQARLFTYRRLFQYILELGPNARPNGSVVDEQKEIAGDEVVVVDNAEFQNKFVCVRKCIHHVGTTLYFERVAPFLERVFVEPVGLPMLHLVFRVRFFHIGELFLRLRRHIRRTTITTHWDERAVQELDVFRQRMIFFQMLAQLKQHRGEGSERLWMGWDGSPNHLEEVIVCSRVIGDIAFAFVTCKIMGMFTKEVHKKLVAAVQVDVVRPKRVCADPIEPMTEFGAVKLRFYVRFVRWRFMFHCATVHSDSSNTRQLDKVPSQYSATFVCHYIGKTRSFH